VVAPRRHDGAAERLTGIGEGMSRSTGAARARRSSRAAIRRAATPERAITAA
jgi:hypothetical protein